MLGERIKDKLILRSGYFQHSEIDVFNVMGNLVISRAVRN